MKLLKIKIIILGLLFFLSLSPQLLLAADLTNWQGELKKTEGPAGYSAVSQATPEEFVGKIIKIVLGILGVIFLGLMVFGGFLWMTAGGSEDKITRAKSIITNSTIGLIIVLTAYAVTYFIVEKLSGATYVG